MQTTRPTVVWDLVLSIVLLIAVLGTTAIVMMLAYLSILMASACDSGCNLDQFGVGYVLSMALPAFFALATIVVTVVLLVKRRRAFWVPLAGIALVVVGWLIGTAIFAASMPQLFENGLF